MTAIERCRARQERKRERQLKGYLQTASRILADLDLRRGVQMKWGDLWCSYLDDPALLECVHSAVAQVAAIHVPRRAVKLYCEGVDTPETTAGYGPAAQAIASPKL